MKRLAMFLVLSVSVTAFALAACSADDGDRVIRIGAAVSETGRYAEEGSHARKGFLLWEEWVNEEYGGVKVGGERYQVELLLYDDQSDPQTTADLVERLIDEDEVDFLLGPYSSTLTQSAIEVAEPRGVILVEGHGSSERLFSQSYRHLFGVLTPAGNYTQSALEALAAAGARSVAIAHVDALFPESVAQGARAWAAEYGLQVTSVHEYPQDTEDFTELLTAVMAEDPDVFIGAGYFNDALRFVRTAKAIGFNPRAMVLTVGATDPALVEQLGPDAEYLIGPTQWEPSMSYQGPHFRNAADYAERYQAKWGDAPAYQAASATAAALALQMAIENAGALDTPAVLDALRALDADTFFGPIRFDETGKNANRPMGAAQVQDGGILVVAPAGAAVAPLRYPAPAWEDR